MCALTTASTIFDPFDRSIESIGRLFLCKFPVNACVVIKIKWNEAHTQAHCRVCQLPTTRTQLLVLLPSRPYPLAHPPYSGTSNGIARRTVGRRTRWTLTATIIDARALECGRVSRTICASQHVNSRVCECVRASEWYWRNEYSVSVNNNWNGPFQLIRRHSHDKIKITENDSRISNCCTIIIVTH